MKNIKKVPYGKINSVAEMGVLVRQHRKSQKVRIEDLSDLALISPRLIGEFERGKETCQIGKVLQILKFLGLEIRIVPRGTP
nr:helix-turn-helix transcriptional regulator [Methylomarinum sp. Ch1-1]MDP4519416.1 helix-turn-helix transcriptional regulator [Methylomarinum sp. Ch1-1]